MFKIQYNYTNYNQFLPKLFFRLLGLKQYTDNMRQVFWRGHPGNDISGTDVHPYWYNRRPQAIDVEATAYALLAQIELVRAKSRGKKHAIFLCLCAPYYRLQCCL